MKFKALVFIRLRSQVDDSPGMEDWDYELTEIGTFPKGIES